MADLVVTNLLNVIKKSNDKHVIVKALIKLRTDHVTERNGIIIFRDAGGISPMVKLLNRPYEKILEVVLSILGNCCTNSECCAQAFEVKIIPPLLTILKSVPNPSIQCRACRLLGNLAKEDRSQLIPHSAGVAQSLCLILEESTDVSTIKMATRAAKFLLHERQFMEHFINNDGSKIIIKKLENIMKNKNQTEEYLEPTEPVGLKVNQHREKYFEEIARHLEGVRSDIFDNELLKKEKKVNLYAMPEDKQNLDLAEEILYCIQIISDHQSQGRAMEFYSYDTNLGLPCISFFAGESNPYRSIALKIISSLSKNPSAISALSSADSVVAACKLLTPENFKTDLSASEIKNCISIISLLSRDACNRAKIRRNGGLKKLLEIARSSNSYNEISVIFFGLMNFQYDNLSIHLMLREGLVSLLIKELNAYLNGSDDERKRKCDEKKTTSRKRKIQTESSEPNNKNLKTYDDYYDEESPIGSPNNFSPSNKSSPCSSRSISPVSNCSKNFLEITKDFETYSPVCSENDVDSSDNDEEMPADDCDVMKLLDMAFKAEANLEDNLTENKDDDEISQDTNSSKIPKNGERNAIDVIDKLLYKVSLLVANHAELSKPETLMALIRSINEFGVNNNTFGSTLTNILSQSQFFAIIIKQDVIHNLYKMSKIEELKTGAINFIDTLTCVAGTPYGKGEIIKLLSHENFAQKKCSIAIAFIIRSPRLLYQLLTEKGALYILINTILSKDDNCRIEAADGITSLAKNLEITLPINRNLQDISEFDESVDFPNINFNKNCDNSNSSNNEITFVLHRGCSEIPIKFDKEILSQNSEVFNLMLNSDFRECNEGKIHLNNYSVNGIKYFLNLINLKSQHKSLNIPPVYYFDSILEAYELSKLYIMTDLEKKLFSMLIYRLNVKTCLKIFEWSLKNFNQEISEIAINYYLCSELDGLDKVELFHEADYSQHSKEWNQMIIDAILVKCQNLCPEFTG